jgi:hypothetical protein
MPALPTDALPVELPADWRERLLRALASEGVTEPPYVPVWRIVLIYYGQVAGGVLLFTLWMFIPVVAAPFVSWKVSAAIAILWLIATSIVLVKFIERAPGIGLKHRSEYGGSTPTHAVMASRWPPIFYLRSFAFDVVAPTAPSKWVPSLTPEMMLILRMRQYAPVLAIGKPGEVNPPPGAMRFHVTDACWEATVKSIVPCCQLVVWVTGNTSGLNWEMEHLVTSLPPHRLLLWPHMNVEVANKLTVDWHATAQQRNAEWQQFVDVHRDIFPKPLPRDIEKIRFIAFDADWTPVPIPSARYPVSRIDGLDGVQDPNGIISGLRSFLVEKFQETFQ